MPLLHTQRIYWGQRLILLWTCLQRQLSTLSIHNQHTSIRPSHLLYATACKCYTSAFFRNTMRNFSCCAVSMHKTYFSSRLASTQNPDAFLQRQSSSSCRHHSASDPSLKWKTDQCFQHDPFRLCLYCYSYCPVTSMDWSFFYVKSPFSSHDMFSPYVKWTDWNLVEDDGNGNLRKQPN